jgi:hypothetical protein
MIAQLIEGLIAAYDIGIDKYLEEKVADVGKEFIVDVAKEFIPGFSEFEETVSGIKRFRKIVTTTEEERLRELGKGVREKLFEELKRLPHGADKTELLNQIFADQDKHLPRWRRSAWARSREDWLENKWKHDWRSQPRNRIGEWIPGRLPYPVVALGQKRPIGRNALRRRKIKARYRRVARIAIKRYYEHH